MNELNHKVEIYFGDRPLADSKFCKWREIIRLHALHALALGVHTFLLAANSIQEVVKVLLVAARHSLGKFAEKLGNSLTQGHIAFYCLDSVMVDQIGKTQPGGALMNSRAGFISANGWRWGSKTSVNS